MFALGAGLHEVVKASLVGSILGNVLRVLGVSTLAGGCAATGQDFEPRAASGQALLLLLATVALIMPAILELVQGPGLPGPRDQAVDYRTRTRTPVASIMRCRGRRGGQRMSRPMRRASLRSAPLR